MKTADEYLKELIDIEYKNVPFSEKTDFQRCHGNVFDFVCKAMILHKNKSIDACIEKGKAIMQSGLSGIYPVLDKRSFIQLKEDTKCKSK